MSLSDAPTFIVNFEGISIRRKDSGAPEARRDLETRNDLDVGVPQRMAPNDLGDPCLFLTMNLTESPKWLLRLRTSLLHQLIYSQSSSVADESKQKQEQMSF